MSLTACGLRSRSLRYAVLPVSWRKHRVRQSKQLPVRPNRYLTLQYQQKCSPAHLEGSSTHLKCSQTHLKPSNRSSPHLTALIRCRTLLFPKLVGFPPLQEDGISVRPSRGRE